MIIYEELDTHYGPVPISWKGYFAGEAIMLDHWWGAIFDTPDYDQKSGADILWERAMVWHDHLQMFNAAAFTVEEGRTKLARERFVVLTKTPQIKSNRTWMDPDYKAMSMNWIGMLYEEEGNLDEALIWYKAGTKRMDEGSRVNLLRFYVNSGELTKAKRICKTMVPWGESFAKNPFIPNLAKFFYSQILFAEGDEFEAQNCYHQYLLYEVTKWFRERLFQSKNGTYFDFGDQRIPLDIAGNETVINFSSGFYPVIHLTFMSGIHTCAATPEQIHSLLPILESYLDDIPWEMLKGSTIGVSSLRYEPF